MRQSAEDRKKPFSALYPEDVLGLAEQSLQRGFTNLYRPLNSYINRVFELEDSDGAGVIVKFYRPGRWPGEAIVEEHVFLQELASSEIPVIAPLVMADGSTLGCWRDIHYAFFPKCGGRSVDEFSDEQWQQLGRLVGRVHATGSIRQALHRQRLVPSASTRGQLHFLEEHGLVAQDVRSAFFTLARRLVEEIDVLFDGVVLQRIHGDLHFSNIIHRPGESFFLIDFDDMATGPQVQDVWMLLQGYGEESLVELDLFLEGYEVFHGFDRRSCRLIEPLRAMRYIHYLAWCGYQVVEDGHTEVLPDYGTSSFWQNETAELADQLERIHTAKSPFGNV
ncbi:MAG TPA: serine/threonine protein kinase [Desulfopila sp.]|nr:serine/threonine protein kinase [Desulfopila sp.]